MNDTWPRDCGHRTHGRPQRLVFEDDRCPRCKHEACVCPSLEEVPYGHLDGEPGYVR